MILDELKRSRIELLVTLATAISTIITAYTVLDKHFHEKQTPVIKCLCVHCKQHRKRPVEYAD